MTATILINLANLLYVMSAMIKTVIRLRIMLIISSVVFIAWSVVSENWSALVWNLLFGLTHAFQLLRLWHRHRSIEVTDEADQIHRRLFPDLDELDFHSLWSAGRPWSWPDNALLITRGQEERAVSLVVRGKVAIERDGEHIATIGPGSFLGERSLFTGTPASATVRAIGDVAVHEWDKATITALTDTCPTAHAAMIRQIGVDLAAKLG